MDRLPVQFVKLDIMVALFEAMPPGRNCWLVGGALRDDLLGVQPGDFDLAFDFDPTEIARSFAATMHGAFVPLDPGRRQSRVVFLREGKRYTLDFTPLRAATLAEDLALRDFTCNALACDLKRPGELIDPLGGEKDLLGGLLRSCSGHVLRDDPLRIVKGIRHAVELNLALMDNLCRQILDYRHLLKGVARERITAELGRIFAHPQVHLGVSMLDRFEILTQLSGSVPLTVDLPGLHNLLSVEKRLADEHHEACLRNPVEDNWTLLALVRLSRSVVTHTDSGTRTPYPFLKQSKNAMSIAAMLRSLAQLEVPRELALDTPRRRALWLDQFRASPPAAALYCASYDRFYRLDPLGCLKDWFRIQIEGRVPDLISAADLIGKWGIDTGPGLGLGLEAIRLDEISGRISLPFREEQLVRSYFKKN